MKNKLHLHSMIVHIPCITIPLTAVFHHLFDFSGNHLYWTMTQYLVAISIITVGAGIITGIIERSHKHANWFSSFKLKMILSTALILSLLYTAWNLITFSADNCGSYSCISVGLLQPIMVIWIMIIGIISSQGRFGGRLSYAKDIEYSSEFDIKEITFNNIKEIEND